MGSGKTDQNEIGKSVERIGALDGREGLEAEVATVAGESDAELEFVGCFDGLHWSSSPWSSRSVGSSDQFQGGSG